MFGRSRVEQIVAECNAESAEALVSSIFAAVAEHVGNEDAFDDQTVVAIRVKGTSGKRK